MLSPCKTLPEFIRAPVERKRIFFNSPLLILGRISAESTDAEHPHPDAPAPKFFFLVSNKRFPQSRCISAALGKSFDISSLKISEPTLPRSPVNIASKS